MFLAPTRSAWRVLTRLQDVVCIEWIGILLCQEEEYQEQIILSQACVEMRDAGAQEPLRKIVMKNREAL
jgi:hypothetical protein